VTAVRALGVRLLVWFSQERWLVGASLVRVLLGMWALYYYALHFPVRHLLWGPTGLWPYERFLGLQPPFSVWQVSPSPVFFEAVYAAGIAVALSFTLGWWTRLSTALHWLLIWSLQTRNPFITDGGDNIMRLALLFLTLVDAGAHFSLDGRRPGRPLPPWWRQVRAIAHNAGVLLIVAQLSMLYMSTGLYKAMGEMWQNGTALYYVLRVDEFSWPQAAALVYRNPYLVVLATYSTVLFEIMFLPLLLNRWTRYGMIACGMAFHGAIAVLMGLVTFAWSMLSLYPLLLTDGEYRQLAGWLRRRWQVIVLYDGWCPLCTRSARGWARCDLLSLVHFVSFRDPGVLATYGLDADRAARRIQVVTASGAVKEGADALVAISGRLVVLWPLAPLLVAVRLAAGQRLYDVVARRRRVLGPGACAGRCPTAARPPARSPG